MTESAQIPEDRLSGLLARWKDGDAAAGDVVVQAYARGVYSFLVRMTGRRQVAEDLMQETFLRVVQNIGRYEHRGRFVAWIYQIAANLGRDYFRKSGREPATFELEVVFGEDADIGAQGTADEAPPRALLRKEEESRLKEAIARLPLAEREIVLMKYFGSLTFQEISEIIGCPIGTALSRMHRALRRLAEWLEQE